MPHTIPDNIRNDSELFDGRYNHFSYTLMEEKEEKLRIALQRSLNERTPQQIQCDLLALVFREPPLESKQLLKLSDDLNLCSKGLIFAVCVKGDVPLLESLIKNNHALLNPTTLKGYKAFGIAAGNAQGAMVKYLLSHADADKKAAMLMSNQCVGLHSACKNGHLSVVEYIFEASEPNQISTMLKTSDYASFIDACKNGYHKIAELICSKSTPEEINAMIKAQKYAAFNGSIENGHFPVVDLLLKHLTPAEKIAMISNEDLFLRLVKADKIEAVRKIVFLAESLKVDYFITNIVKATKNSAFFSAKSPEMVQLIKDYLMGHEFRNNLIKENRQQVFDTVVASGDIVLLQDLYQLSKPEEIQQLIIAQDFKNFRSLLKNERFELAKYIMARYPNKEQLQTIIAEECYDTWVSAILYKKPPKISVIMELAQDKVDTMILKYDGHALKNYLYHISAAGFQHNYIGTLLNQREVTLAYYSYDQFEEALSSTNWRVKDLNNHALTSEEAKFYLYSLRALLIRIPEGRRFGVSWFYGERLLQIPAMQDIAHRALYPQWKADSKEPKIINDNQPNELLRIAMATRNDPAITQLLNIPKVRELAKKENYYRDLYCSHFKDWDQLFFYSPLKNSPHFKDWCKLRSQLSFQNLICKLTARTEEDRKEAEFMRLLIPLMAKNFVISSSADKARTEVIDTLTKAASTFFSKPPTKDSYNEFFRQWDSLKDAKSVLAEHRFFLGAVFVAIRNFLVALKRTIFCEENRTSFFSAKTDSAEIMDAVGEGLNGLKM